MNHETENNKKITPKKRLGQNFLTQIGVIQKLVAAANIQPGQTILEIGPGTGNLTAELVKTGNKVIVVEKDREMIEILKERLPHCGGPTPASSRGLDPRNNQLRIINQDALRFDETAIAPPYKIAANLPFYLAAPLIRKFLESQNPPLSLTVIVQKEVAQRICAQPPQMSLLAISVQFYASVKIIDYISRGSFWPAPKVDCAILQIEPHIKEGDIYEAKFIAKFFQIAKAGFSHPRKQLAGNLANGLNLDKIQITAGLAKNNLAPECRAETLTVENWIGLTQTFEL
jgi:16S rRNA (adenine1518-N6/adenine1519-N6)-dimethyltransferase